MKLGSTISDGFRAVGRTLGITWQWIICTLSNIRRSLFRGRLADYAVIALDHDISGTRPDCALVVRLHTGPQITPQSGIHHRCLATHCRGP